MCRTVPARIFFRIRRKQLSKAIPKKRFASKGYEQFYHEMLKKSGINESYHRSFLLYGISDIVRTNIGRELSVNNHDVQRK